MDGFAVEMISVAFSCNGSFDLKEQIQRLATLVHMHAAEYENSQVGMRRIESCSMAVKACKELMVMLRLVGAERSHITTVDYFCYRLRKALATERKFSNFAGQKNKQG